MKRNKNLVNLSSEHHDGLVISLRIKKALEKLDNQTIIINYIKHLWSSLNNHFKQEESNFLAYNCIDSKNELIKRMLDEHKQFEILVQNLSESKTKKEDLTKFAELLNDHIRFEERELFPFIEESLSEEELKQIGINIEETHQPLDKNWGPKFWD